MAARMFAGRSFEGEKLPTSETRTRPRSSKTDAPTMPRSRARRVTKAGS